MTGLFLLLVIGLWLVFAIWLSKVITRSLPETKWRGSIRFVAFSVLLPLPVIDEIVGGWQFRRLCEENATIQVDRATAGGKTVYLAKPSNVEITKTWVRVVMKPWRYVDVATEETVVSFSMFMASGGRFIRTLGISEGGMPLTFNGHCKTNLLIEKSTLFKEIGITQIDRRNLQKLNDVPKREETK